MDAGHPSDALQVYAEPVDIRTVDAAHGNRRKLGELLVEEGFLTKEQLADALEHALATGRRLGTVLVERGVLSGPALANMLADQQGGIVRTEYGIASGFRGTRTPPPTDDIERSSEYVVVVARDGRYALYAGTGALPAEGTEVVLPSHPDEHFVAARHEWRRCVVFEPVAAPVRAAV